MFTRKPESTTEQIERGLGEIERFLSGDDPDQPPNKPTNRWLKAAQPWLKSVLVITVLMSLVVTVGRSYYEVDDKPVVAETNTSMAAPVTRTPSSTETQTNEETKVVVSEAAVITADVPIVVAEVSDDTETSALETPKVPIASAEVVDQTKLDTTVVEVPEGVTENQFAAMEQTAPQPKLDSKATAIMVPESTLSTSVSPPTAAPAFSSEFVSYLAVETLVPKPLVWWKRLLEGVSYAVRDSTTARGEARYEVDVGEVVSHRETVTLSLVVPSATAVRGVTTDAETELSDDEVRTKLVSSACLDVDNLRAVMDMAETRLATEAGDYELQLSWYTHQGQRISRDVSDAELISYCQLG